MYVEKKGRKKESFVEVFKKIKVRKFFNLLSCYVCVRKNILTLPFVFVFFGCGVVLVVTSNEEQFV